MLTIDRTQNILKQTNKNTRQRVLYTKHAKVEVFGEAMLVWKSWGVFVCFDLFLQKAISSFRKSFGTENTTKGKDEHLLSWCHLLLLQRKPFLLQLLSEKNENCSSISSNCYISVGNFKKSVKFLFPVNCSSPWPSGIWKTDAKCRVAIKFIQHVTDIQRTREKNNRMNRGLADGVGSCLCLCP